MPRAMIRTKDANRNAMLLITFDVPDANGSRHAGSRRPSVLGALTCGTLAPSPANCHPTPPQPERGQARLQQHYVQPRQAGVGRRGELSECWATICVEPTRYIYRIKIPPNRIKIPPPDSLTRARELLLRAGIGLHADLSGVCTKFRVWWCRRSCRCNRMGCPCRLRCRRCSRAE